MTTRTRSATSAASSDQRTAYRRLVLAAARGEPLRDVARVGLAGICAVTGWPVGQLRIVDRRGGACRAVGAATTFGTDLRPELAPALTGAWPAADDPVTTALTTARPCWSAPDPPDGIRRLAVPLASGDVVGVIELVDDRPHELDAEAFALLTDMAEVLGAAVVRDRVAATGSPPCPTISGEAADGGGAVAMRERAELDRQRLREAEMIGSFGVWELMPGRSFEWSEEMCRIHGVPPDYLPTVESNLELIHPEDFHIVDEYSNQLRADLVAPPVQYRIVQPGGAVRWVESHTRVLDGDRVIGITRDITDQRASEQRERLRSQIVQTMTEGVALVRADHTIVYVNPQFAAMFGYTPEEMEGRNIWDYSDPADRPGPDDAVEPKVDDVHIELDHVRRDGRPFTTIAHITAMPVDGELAWLSVERDITEEKTRSEALRESRERLALIQQLAPIGLALVDLDGHFTQANPALCDITGRTEEQLAQVTFRDITHPDDVDDCDDGIARLLAGEISRYEGDKRYVRPDGEVVWVFVTVAVTRDEDGAPLYFIGQVMDIGARKQADEARARHAALLERSNAELRRATRQTERAHRAAVEANRAKNEFLSRMSHELRTPLNAVLGFAQLLGMEPLPDKQLDMVAQVLRAGRHLLMLIDEVLDIARIENGTMTVIVEPVDLVAAFGHARSLLGPLVRERDVEVLDVVVAGEGPPPLVAADRQRVVQILLNLLSNAVKYNVPGGRVSVEVRREGPRLRLAVTDTGHGIAADVLPRVFEPFDRLGAEHTGVEGTGIGLTVSRALAEQMDGQLTVSSVVGEGSTFTLELPLATPATASPSR